MSVEPDACSVATALALAYLIGGIPFGYLVGRLRGVDVRTVGSKNIGATNVFRTVGKGWGVLALVCDVLKGLIPTMIATAVMPAAALWVGVACVLGHMLTPYMRFRGGKGVATTLGMLIALMPTFSLVAFVLFAVAFACTHWISLGSCVAAVFLAVGVWFRWLGLNGVADLSQCVLVTLMSLFVIFKHRANLRRIASGVENKTYLFRPSGAA